MATQRTRDAAVLEEVARALNHDVRAPVRHLRSFTELVLDQHGAALPEEAVDYLTRAHAAAIRLGGMVDVLVEYIRLGTRPPTVTELDVAEVVAGVERRVAPRVQAARGSLRVIGEPAGTVYADWDTLLRAADVVATATIRHGGDSPALVVRATSGPDDVTLDILDERPDRAAPDPTELFGPFPPPGFDPGDAGLGVALRALEAFGGTVAPLPTPVGFGYRISLPASGSAAGSAPSTSPGA